MPDGIHVDLDDGVATVEFLDPALRGPALGVLLGIGGAASIKTITREGPRVKYRVSEELARQAGLLDEPVRRKPIQAPGGGPSTDWSRPALNTYASTHGVADPELYANKQALLDAIAAAPPVPTVIEDSYPEGD